MRARWQELQLRFVDDPSGVAGQVRALVAEAVRAVTEALAEQQRQLDSWSTAEGGDTEQLRVVVQRYRDFFDRMLDRAV
jgi:predicted secreted Zn-dependent protease